MALDQLRLPSTHTLHLSASPSDRWVTVKYRQFKSITMAQVVQYCKESSLFLFHKDSSRLRKLFARMLGTKFWDRGTLCLIFANGVLLAYDHPLKGDGNVELDAI